MRRGVRRAKPLQLRCISTFQGPHQDPTVCLIDDRGRIGDAELDDFDRAAVNQVDKRLERLEARHAAHVEHLIDA